MSTPQDAPKKNIFADILSAPSVDALEKYANLFTSITPNELASIDQGKAFIPYVDKLIAGQFAPPSPSLIAIPSGMQTVAAHGVPVAELLADGFPTDKKIHLFMYFEGPKVEEMASTRATTSASTSRWLSASISASRVSPAIRTACCSTSRDKCQIATKTQ